MYPLYDIIFKEGGKNVMINILFDCPNIDDFYDDHLAPGDGKVDFAELAPLMRTVRHVVFEPNSNVKEEQLKAAVKFISGLTDDE
jgi:sugar phosphate isomerase/epimerase